jgi:hypothetical protein
MEVRSIDQEPSQPDKNYVSRFPEADSLMPSFQISSWGAVLSSTIRCWALGTRAFRGQTLWSQSPIEGVISRTRPARSVRLDLKWSQLSLPLPNRCASLLLSLSPEPMVNMTTEVSRNKALRNVKLHQNRKQNQCPFPSLSSRADCLVAGGIMPARSSARSLPCLIGSKAECGRERAWRFSGFGGV